MVRTDIGCWTLVRFEWSRQSRRFAPFPSIAKFMGRRSTPFSRLSGSLGWSEPDMVEIWKVLGGALTVLQEHGLDASGWIHLCRDLLFFNHVLVFHECSDGQQHGVLHSISRLPFADNAVRLSAAETSISVVDRVVTRPHHTYL